MIYQIAFQVFWGLPLVAWGGIATLASMLVTALLGYLYHTGKANFRFHWHWTMALTTIALALAHGAAAILALLGF